jgi:hypothetical protein
LHTHLVNASHINTTIHNELIEPLYECIAHITTQNELALSELNDIAMKVNNQKAFLTNMKNTYFTSCKAATDRLICLYLPEVFSHLKLQNVSIAYYASPWFVTLFTNALNYIDEHNGKPNALILIFDKFVCDGWKAVIKVGCV